MKSKEKNTFWKPAAFFTQCYIRKISRLILLVSVFLIMCLFLWINLDFQKEQLGEAISKLIKDKETVFLNIQKGEKMIKRLNQENQALKSNLQLFEKKFKNRNGKILQKKTNQPQKNFDKNLSIKFKKEFISKRKTGNKPNITHCDSKLNHDFLNYIIAGLQNTPYPGVENYTNYAKARLGLSSLTEVESLDPDFGPVINDILSFEYPLSISPCQEITSANRSIFVAVISAPTNFKKRDIIRNTWKNHLHTAHNERILGIAGFGFILGLPENEKTQIKITEESRKHNDIIQIQMPDFYRNLSLKVSGLLNWLYKLCTKMDFILKVDDDVYVNVRNVAHFVNSYHKSDLSIFGVGDPNGGLPDRDGKWRISFEEWPWKDYPHYFLGATVLMHGTTILPLLAACQTTPIIPFDDLYIFGMCTEKAGIKLYFSSGLTRVLLGVILWIPTTCELRNLIAWRINSDNIEKFQENMEYSYTIVNQFYQNKTRCIIKSSYNGSERIVDHTKKIHFNFI